MFTIAKLISILLYLITLCWIKKLGYWNFYKPKKPSHNFQIENFTAIDLHGYKQESKKKKRSCVWLIKVNQNSDTISYCCLSITMNSFNVEKGKVHMLPFLSSFHSSFGFARQLKAGWSSGPSAFIWCLLPLTQTPEWLGQTPGIHSRSFHVKPGVSNVTTLIYAKGTEVRVVFLNHQSLYIPGPGQAGRTGYSQMKVIIYYCESVPRSGRNYLV